MSEQETLILVVDDNEMNRDMLSRRLQRHNYTTLSAENGARALEMMREHRFDLVMLDIMMPKMNGYEVLETVKKDPDLRHIPIIMISAVDDLDSVVKCIEMGAEDYLFKPFNPVLLKARVSASLDKARMLNGGGAGEAELRDALRPLAEAIANDAAALLRGDSDAAARIHAASGRLLALL
jgi:CheY-like chemotaxis protein